MREYKLQANCSISPCKFPQVFYKIRPICGNSQKFTIFSVFFVRYERNPVTLFPPRFDRFPEGPYLWRYSSKSGMPGLRHSEWVPDRHRRVCQRTCPQSPSATVDSRRNPALALYSMTSRPVEYFSGRSHRNTFPHPGECILSPVSAAGHFSTHCPEISCRHFPFLHRELSLFSPFSGTISTAVPKTPVTDPFAPAGFPAPPRIPSIHIPPVPEAAP